MPATVRVLLPFLFVAGAIDAMQNGPIAERTPMHLGLPDGIRGRSPRPTKSPFRAKRREYGGMPMNELFARQDQSHNTCGWYSGNPDYPITCTASGSDVGCAYYNSETPLNFWCCPYTNGEPDSNGCGYASTCLSYGDSSNTNTDTAVLYDASQSVIMCPSSFSNCITTELIISVSNTYLQYACGTEALVYTAYGTTNDALTTSSGFTSISTPSQAAVTTTAVMTETQTLDHTVTVIATPDINGGAGPSASTPSTASTSSATPSPTSDSSHTNVGAIAGGTVGGVAGVALIAGLIGYLVWRKKSERVQPMREVSQMSPNAW